LQLSLHCDADLCLQLVSFGAGILNGVDPNPDNFVCASILHTSAHQVGCLMRLEPNKQVQVGDAFVLTGFSSDFCRTYYYY